MDGPDAPESLAVARLLLPGVTSGFHEKQVLPSCPWVGKIMSRPALAAWPLRVGHFAPRVAPQKG